MLQGRITGTLKKELKCANQKMKKVVEEIRSAIVNFFVIMNSACFSLRFATTFHLSFYICTVSLILLINSTENTQLWSFV